MAVLTNEGFQIRTLDQIVQQISGNLKAAFGNSFDTSPESPDGQLIGIFAEQIYMLEQAGQAVYQSNDPDRAVGEALEYVCDYNGVYRQLETPTSVPVTFSGTAGTTVPQGVVVATEDGLQFVTDRSVEVGTPVSATCTETGANDVPVNTVTVIKSPVAGITSVTNNTAGTSGTDREADSALRYRRSRSVINSGNNTAESIYSGVINAGAEFVSIKQNVTNAAVDGIPPHSFVTVVKGLDDNDVAELIFENKPAGIEAAGSVKVNVADSKGYEHVIGFERPTDVPIDVEVTFRKVSGATNDIKEYITEAITTDINTYQKIGQEVLWSDIFAAAVFASNGGSSVIRPEPDSLATSIRSVKIKRQGSGDFGTADLPMSFKEKAVAGTITVTEVS